MGSITVGTAAMANGAGTGTFKASLAGFAAPTPGAAGALFSRTPPVATMIGGVGNEDASGMSDEDEWSRIPGRTC